MGRFSDLVFLSELPIGRVVEYNFIETFSVKKKKKKPDDWSKLNVYHKKFTR